MTIEELAREIGIDRSTMYRKFKSQGEDFSIKEANLIVEALELNKDEAMAIFFTQLVA
jgi:DNA-binding phage protein